MKLKSNSGYNIGDLDILYWLCFDLVYMESGWFVLKRWCI